MEEEKKDGSENKVNCAEVSLEGLIDQETLTNRYWVVCARCGSKILRPSFGQYHTVEYKLPTMGPKGKNQTGEFEEEDLKDFWLVHDMLTFENIGFTNTCNNLKYLICADCEIGPIGFQNLSDMKSLYVSINRVGHNE